MTGDNYGIEQNAEHKFWYNMKTGQVEQGFVSPAPDRVGPSVGAHAGPGAVGCFMFPAALARSTPAAS